MALQAVDVAGSPAWWMTRLAARMLATNRLRRFGILDAYRSGRPPLLNASETARRIYYEYLQRSRTNFARVVVRAPAERMAVRAIRTAAAGDEAGDAQAWAYWTGSGLEVAETDVYSDMLTFAETYMRVAVQADGSPVGLRCDPWATITAPDPLDPLRARAAFHMAWDEWSGATYAYLWLPGVQWVASAPSAPPSRVNVPGTLTSGHWRREGLPRYSFSPQVFTMRPDRSDVDAGSDDGGPYCESYRHPVVPVVPFLNRDGVGEFEEHLDLLDRINGSVSERVVTQAVQTYKQRALQQPTEGPDRLPTNNPDTGAAIDWDAVFRPGPDALWKLPPGVTIWESAQTQLQPLISGEQEDAKKLSSVTSTPFSLFSPDGMNQSAEGAQLTREGLVFKVEDRDKIAARSWARVQSFMFLFAPDSERYDAAGNDRADAGRIVLDWKPAERFSLAEKAQADSMNRSLSRDMAAVKIWQLTPDEVSINRAQVAADALMAPAAGVAGNAGPGSG